MATVVQFGTQRKPVGIDQDLKAFIDGVIVTILVKEYLDMAEHMVVAARFLRINPQDVRNQPGLGVIPGIQTAKIWRFRAFMLNCWLRLSARSL